MKKKPLLALMLAVVVACLISLSGCGGPTVEQLINEDLTNQLDEIKNNDESFLDGLDKVAGKEFKKGRHQYRGIRQELSRGFRL